MERKDEQQLGEDDRQALEVDSLRAGVVEVLHLEHGRVKVFRDLAEAPLKRRKEGRVVERPFRCFLELRGSVRSGFPATTQNYIFIFIREELKGVCYFTSKYHSLTGRECVMASQLRWTSKSVDLLLRSASSSTPPTTHAQSQGQ